MHTYDRGSSLGAQFTRISTLHGEEILPVQVFKSRLGIDDIVRIHPKDYPSRTVQSGAILTHFGLELPKESETAGSVALLAEIVQPGFKTDHDEVLPLLNPHGWIVCIIECIQSVRPQDISVEYFRHTIGGITGLFSLQCAVVNRYRRSLPDQSVEQILARRVSIRRIRLDHVVNE